MGGVLRPSRLLGSSRSSPAALPMPAQLSLRSSACARSSAPSVAPSIPRKRRTHPHSCLGVIAHRRPALYL